MYKLMEIKNGAEGRVFSLKGVVHEIGRESSCDIYLPDNRKASRIHARLEKDREAWWIVDLDSTNGTYVNRERIKAKELKSGDEIAIGDSSFLFLEDSNAEFKRDITATEIENPRIDVSIQNDSEIKKGKQKLTILLAAFLILTIGVWIFYSFYIGKMARIHSIADIINSEAQSIELIYGDVKTSSSIAFNIDLINNNMPPIINFLTRAQDNLRLSIEIKRTSPAVSLMAVKKGSDDVIELQQHIGEYKKSMEQILSATESFKMIQERKTYNLLIKAYTKTAVEIDRSKSVFFKYREELANLNDLIISLDKVSSKLVPGLSKNSAIVIDSSNKIQNSLLRLIDNMDKEKAFILKIKG